MSESSSKPSGSLAYLGDYDSDEKEESPTPSQQPMETDEKTEVEVARASSAEADSEQAASPAGPEPTSSVVDDKKSDDEFKVESSSKEETGSKEEPMDTSYKKDYCLSEESSDDEDDIDRKKSPSQNQKDREDRKPSQSPKEEPNDETMEVEADDSNHSKHGPGSPKTMNEADFKQEEEPIPDSPESPDYIIAARASSSEFTFKPISPKVEEQMEIQEDSVEKQGTSEDLAEVKSSKDSPVAPVENAPSPKPLNASPIDGPKSRESSKSPESDAASPTEDSKSPEPAAAASPLEKSKSKSPEPTSASPLEKSESKSPEPAATSPLEKSKSPEPIASSPLEAPKSHESSGSQARGSQSPKNYTPAPAKDVSSPLTLDEAREAKASESPIAASPESPTHSDDSDYEEDDEMDSTEKMDTLEKVNTPEKSGNVSDNEPGTSSEGSRSLSRNATPDSKPWQSPRVEPVEGIVQPRTDPPKGKPTRHTNCLDYVLFTVIKDAVKHKHSWPFQVPVDAKSLELPTYHKMITRPMDLCTIERRIRNVYYWCAQDAIEDINQLFNNCYKFNPPEYDVYKMAKTLQGKINAQLKDLPRSEKEQEFPEHLRNTMFLGNNPNGKPKTPQKRGRKSGRGRKKGGFPPRAASSFKETMDEDPDDASSVVGSVFEEDESITSTTRNEEESMDTTATEEVEEPTPSTSQPPAKKRKVENGDNGVIASKEATPVPALQLAPTPKPAVPRKNPNTMIDWKSLTPRWHGKQSEWQKFCSKLIQEMHSLKNKGFAQIFYLPVDPIKLKIHDYLDVIKKPMDLQTIKKKLDHKQYAEPEEFVDDMNLMIDNCCTYNPKGSAVHQNALDLKALFEERWKLFPRPGVSKIVSDSYINQSLIVNTDFLEDERINSYLSAVKAEEKKCAEKLEQLRSMSEGLYTIAMQRREAKLAGSLAPALAPNQLTQLDNLGINISNAPVMVPELISPALSVRSSNRAPVPKVIDDIGPSPVKFRRISKPRASISSVPPTPTTTGKTRGRKPKNGPKKINYSPATSSPHSTLHTPLHATTKKKYHYMDIQTLSEKISRLEENYVHPILRLYQISQMENNKDILSMATLCDIEIDFNDAKPETINEMVEYIDMVENNLAKAQEYRQQMEVKAKIYGFSAFDEIKGVIPRNKINQAQIQNRMRSDSPPPSASRSGNRSSDTDSSEDSSDSDSEPPTPRNNPVAPKQRRVISGNSSRASTPAAGSSAAAPAPSRPHKGGSSKPGYTLSEESSSSSDSNGSSDSSDSDSDAEAHKKRGVSKKDVVKNIPKVTKTSSSNFESGKKSSKPLNPSRSLTSRDPSPASSQKSSRVQSREHSVSFKPRKALSMLSRASSQDVGSSRESSLDPSSRSSPDELSLKKKSAEGKSKSLSSPSKDPSSSSLVKKASLPQDQDDLFSKKRIAHRAKEPTPEPTRKAHVPSTKPTSSHSMNRMSIPRKKSPSPVNKDLNSIVNKIKNKPQPPVKKTITILDQLLPCTPSKPKVGETLPKKPAPPARRSTPPAEAIDWRKLRAETIKRKAEERANEPEPYQSPEEVLGILKATYPNWGEDYHYHHQNCVDCYRAERVCSLFQPIQPVHPPTNQPNRSTKPPVKPPIKHR